MMAKSFSDDETSTFKTCTKCNISKPLSLFYRNAIQPDGHEKVCIDCRNLRENTYLPVIEPVSVETEKSEKKMITPTTKKPKVDDALFTDEETKKPVKKPAKSRVKKNK